MPPIPFIGAAYTVRSRNLAADRMVNLYAELVETSKGKNVGALYGTPGLKRFLTLPGTGSVRGLWTVSGGRCFAVQGSGFYEVYANATSMLLGTIGTTTGPVSMDDNGLHVLLVDGSSTGYALTLATTSFAPVTDADFGGADRVAFVDGYFAFNRPNTGQWGISDLYALTFDALDFATAEGRPDRLRSLLSDHREVWLFGDTTTEVWFNAGLADFPFARIQGAFVEHGTAAAHSPTKLNNTVYWLSANEDGARMVLRARGYIPERISTHAIEFALNGYSSVSDAIGWSYQQEGHSHYVLSFPTGNATWVFDETTQLWHERAYRDPATGVLGRHRANCHTYAFDKHLVGDHTDGRVYELDLATFTDDGDPLPAIRRCPHVATIEGDLQHVRHRRFQLDLETGIGLDGSPAVGADPQVLLRWSDDGGHTFSQAHWRPAGKLGTYSTRAVWHRLGRSRDRVYEITFSDPVKRALIGAYLKVG